VFEQDRLAQQEVRSNEARPGSTESSTA
jgi:hypothetical protein